MEVQEIIKRLEGLPIQKLYQIAIESGLHGNSLKLISRGHRKTIYKPTKEKLEAYFERKDREATTHEDLQRPMGTGTEEDT